MNKPESHQPCDSGSLTTCLASVALCTRSRRRIAGTLGIQTPATFGALAVRRLAPLHRSFSPPWSDHDLRIAPEMMSELIGTGLYSSSTLLGLRLTRHPCA